MKTAGSKRWREAQQHELEFWRRWRHIAPYRNLDLEQYWAGERVRFGVPPDFFSGKRVLDAGCGPVGLIHFLPEAALRIRLDPLLRDYAERLSLPEPGLSLVAKAEQLPLLSDTVEVVICFNALDHMQDPQGALRELCRVAHPGGTVLLMVHTFPRWALPLLAVDRLHPHHWTRDEFVGQVARYFRVVRSVTVRRTFHVPARDRWCLSCCKYLAAGLVLSSTYVVASRASAQLDTAGPGV